MNNEPKTNSCSADEIVLWLRDYSKTRINSRIIDSRRTIPPHIILDFGARGLFGMLVEKKYGGLDFSYGDISRVLEQLAAIDMSLGILVLDSLLGAHTLRNIAVSSVREKQLKNLASGRLLSAVAISEPSAGSNPRAMRTTAVSDGNGGWVLNGEKSWVGYASWAGVINVFAKVVDNSKQMGIAGFSIPQGTEGLIIGAETETMGLKGFPKHTVILKNVRVTEDNLIGKLGEGMETAQETMMFIRFCLGALCLGGIKRCIQITYNYVSKRNIATGLLLDNPSCQLKISDMFHQAKALESIIQFVSESLDMDVVVPESAYITCKTAGAEYFQDVADNMIQLLGARGYEEKNIAPRMYRDARPFRIFEGPTDVLLNFLGVISLYENSDTENLLRNLFCDNELANTLEGYVQKMQTNMGAEDTLFGDKRNSSIYQKTLVGEVAEKLILIGGVKHRARKEEESMSSTVAWLEDKLEQAIDAGKYQKINQFIVPPDSLLSFHGAHQQSIGEVFQTLPGDCVDVPDRFLLPTPQKMDSTSIKVFGSISGDNVVPDLYTESVIELFYKQVIAHATNQCLVEQKKTYTYAQLWYYVQELSTNLKLVGIKPTDKVGIFCERSLASVTALLSVLRLGATVIPLDISNPMDRTRYIIMDSDMKYLLSQEKLRKELPEDIPVLIIDDLFPPTEIDVNIENIIPNKSIVHSESLAYMIYTSGTSGKPKGVMIGHSALTNFAITSCKKFGMTESDRVLHFSNTGFDTLMEEIFCAILSGAALVLRSEKYPSPVTLVRDCIENEITFLDLPTSFWVQTVAYLANKKVKIPPSLNTVVLGGEKLPIKSLNLWKKINCTKNITLWNTYGPTETCVVAISSRIDNQSSVEYSDIDPPIGIPDENVICYIVDSSNLPVDENEPGELLIGGFGVGLGYYGNSELTKKCFIPNPFLNKESIERAPVDLLYRTGDLVKYDSKGLIHFVGRIDDQVKIRGYRVELDEVRTVIERLDYILQSEILVEFLDNGEKRLVAFFKTTANARIPTDNLVETITLDLTKLMPDYMRPTKFVHLQCFPLNSNNKIDKSNLREILKNDNINRNQNIQGTDTEIIVGKIWSRYLNVDVGVDSNFFEIGGTSLNAYEISASINKALQTDFKTSTLFKFPVLRDLAKKIDQISSVTATGSSNHTFEPNAAKSPKKQVGFLAEQMSNRLETQMYLADQLCRSYGSKKVYNCNLLLSLNTKIRNVSKFRQSIRELVERQPSLRVNFYMKEKGLLKVNSDFSNIDYSEVDLKRAEIRQHIESYSISFDVHSEALIRFCLIYILDEKTHALLLDVHHIVFDGGSIKPLISDLILLYNDEPLVPISSNLIGDQPIEGVNEVAKKFWLNFLKGDIPCINLPKKYSLTKTEQYVGDCLEFELEDKVIVEVQSYCAQHNITSNIFYFSVYSILLAKFTNQEDLIIGCPFSTRNENDTTLIGLFTNILPVRVQPFNSKLVSEYFEEVGEIFWEILDVRDYPYTSIIKDLSNFRSEGSNPLFDVMFASEEVNLPAFDSDTAPITYEECSNRTAKLDLIFVSKVENGNYTFWFEYSTAISQSVMENMVCGYRELVSTILDKDSLYIEQLTVISEVEKNKLESWGNIQRIDPLIELHLVSSETVLDHIYHFCRSGNSSVAIRTADEVVTYSELSKKVDDLTRFLHKHHSDTKVIGVYLERGANLIISILGILKFGAAYVPLDPAYPSGRLNYMISDSGAGLIFTDIEIDDQLLPPNVKVYYVNNSNEAASTEIIRPTVEKSKSAKRINGNDLAYIIYTSGTTGTPKGVPITHQALKQSTLTRIDYYKEPVESFYLFPSYSFDSSVAVIFWTLATGGELFIASQDKYKDIDYVRLCISKYQISHMLCVPSFFSVLLQSDESNELSSLKTVITAGDVFDKSILVKSQSYNYRLFNEYGPTEATVWSSVYEINIDKIYDSIPIGRPIKGHQFYVLDKNLNLVPSECEGELHIRSACLTDGYINKPVLTAESLISTNINNVQVRLYRTGDIVKWSDIGQLIYSGRKDNQIKIQGFRIEIGEIEVGLKGVSGIEESVVIVKMMGARKNLVAFYVSAIEIPEIEIRRVLNNTIPSYMIPSYYRRLDSIPLTTVGKIDRIKLSTLDIARYQPKDKLTTDLENILAKIFVNIFPEQAGKIGKNSSFFEMGGDSIASLQLVSQARKNNVNLSVDKILKFQTIEAISQSIIEEGQLSKTRGKGYSDYLQLRGEKYSIHPIQKWFLKKRFNNSDHWNLTFSVDVESNLSVIHVEESLDIIVKFHDTLRLQFMQGIDGEWYQSYIDSIDVKECILVFEAENHKAGYLEILQRTVLSSIQNKFQIGIGPLFRVGVIVSEGAVKTLVFAAHHLIFDVASTHIIIQDFTTLIENIRDDKPLILSNYTTPYGIWAKNLSVISQDLVRTPRYIEYWRNIERCDAVRLPKVGDGISKVGAVSSSVTLEFEIVSRIFDSAYLSNQSVFSTNSHELLLAITARAFMTICDGVSVKFKMEGHGRNLISSHESSDLDSSNTIGWYTSTYPLLLKFETIKNSVEDLKVVSETIKKTPHRGASYSILKYLSDSLISDAAITIKPEIIFNYMGVLSRKNVETKVLSNLRFDTTYTVDPENGRNAPIELNMYIADGTLCYSINYDGETVSESFCKQLKEEIVNLTDIYEIEINDAIESESYPVTEFQHIVIDQYEKSGDVPIYQCQKSFYVNYLVSGIAIFGSAFVVMINRHRSLRSFFVRDGGLVNQMVRNEMESVDVYYEDLFGLSKDSQETTIARQIDRERLYNFDHFNPNETLIRFCVFKLKSDSYLVNYTISHAICDGWSNALFMSDLAELLKGNRLKKPGSNFGAKLAYIDEYKYLLGSEDNALFWEDQLIKCNQSDNKLDKYRQSDCYGAVSLVLPQYYHLAFCNLAKEVAVTAKAIFIYCYIRSLQECLSRSRIAFGLVSNGRKSQFNGVLEEYGLFWNLCPFIFDVDRENNSVKGFSNKRVLKRDLLGIQSQLNKLESINSICPVNGVDSPVKTQDLFDCTFGYTNFDSHFAPNDAMIEIDSSADLYHHSLNLNVNSTDKKEFYITVSFHGVQRFLCEEILSQFQKECSYLSTDLYEITRTSETADFDSGAAL